MSATVIMVRVTPRSDRDAVVGVDDNGALRVRVTAAPVDGAANEAVIRVVAKGLGVAKSAITIKSGAGARIKRLRIDGVNQYDIRARWPRIAIDRRHSR